MKGIFSIAKNGNWYTAESYTCFGCPECCQCGNEDCSCPDNCTPLPKGSLCNGYMDQCIAQLECPKNVCVPGCECFVFDDEVCCGHKVE